MGISWEIKMEVKAIYKITNRINGKIYIGISSNPSRRFREHYISNTQYVSLINRAMRKWGIENFDLEVLEWTENWMVREQEHIQNFRSISPNGYNIHKGGNIPPIRSGESSNLATISEQVARAIQKDLSNYKIHRKTIWKKYNVSMDLIRHINDGSSWKDPTLTYPIRPSESELNAQRAQEVIRLLERTTLTQKEIGQQVGWCRTAITAINQGQNHFDPNKSYPIRK